MLSRAVSCCWGCLDPLGPAPTVRLERRANRFVNHDPAEVQQQSTEARSKYPPREHRQQLSRLARHADSSNGSGCLAMLPV
jgi:hypothetical protein